MPQSSDTDGLAGLIASVRTGTSSFYRDQWGSAEVFEDLPSINQAALAQVPLSQRSYVSGKGLVRIVHGPRPFLMKQRLSDIALEPYGDSESSRSLVLFSNGHDALEKTMWFYEHDTLPLIGEITNVPASVFPALRFKIDSLVTEERMLVPFLEEPDVSSLPLSSLTLVGNQFDVTLLPSLRKRFARIRLLLALPETGVFAISCPEALEQNEFRFHPHNAFVELLDRALAVTKQRMLVTPIIRYQSGIRALLTPSACRCGGTTIELKPTP